MPEIFNTLSVVGQSDAAPYVPPSGWQYVSGTMRIVSQGLGLGSGTDAFLRDNKVLNGSPIGARVRVVNMSGDARGCALLNDAGNGYALLCNTTNIRLFAVAGFVTQTGTVLKTISTALVNGDTVDLLATGTSYSVRRNGVAIDTAFIGTAYSGLRAVGLSRALNGRFDQLASIESPAFFIDTLTSPLVPGAAVSGTQTGLFDFPAEADFGGLTVEILPSGSNFTGTMSSFVDGGLCPLLPATAVSGTFDQGGNTASISRDISTPVGLQELRDGSNNPANFSGLVLGDAKYLGQAFVDGGNPLTNADRSYVSPLYGLKISQDGRVEINGTDHATDPVPALPYTTTLWIRRGATGRVYEHQLTINEVGGSVVVTGGGLVMTGLAMSGLTMTGLTFNGL